MSIDSATVDHVALLARLALSKQERHQLQGELSAIIDHINLIGEADTSQVPATAHILPVNNVMAPDQARPSYPAAKLVENAPASENQYIRVRAVLEE